MSLVVGWCDPGGSRSVAGEFTRSIAQLTAYEASQGRLRGVLRLEHGPLMSEARNRLIDLFIQTGSEWLLMVDTDMVFHYKAAQELLDTGEHVVGGLCFGVSAEVGTFPTLYQQIGDRTMVQFDYPDNQLVPVAATGSAFILQHRSVFVDHRRPDEAWPWYHRHRVERSGDAPAGYLGEDMSWCWWLNQQGQPVYVHTGVKIGHGSDLLGPLHKYQSDEFSLKAEVLGNHGAIKAATMTNAEIIRQQDKLGQVKEGFLADLIVVDGDPLKDIGVLENDGAKVRLVMKAGEVFKDQLDAA